MCPSCFQGVVDNTSHMCKVSTKEAVEALPDELAAKVVHSYLANKIRHLENIQVSSSWAWDKFSRCPVS